MRRYGLGICVALCVASISAAQKPRLKDPSTAWVAKVSADLVYDTNIERDDTSQHSIGRILAVGLRYRKERKHDALFGAYDAALHEYSNSDTYDRTSHQIALGYSRELNKKWDFEIEGEVSFKGSNDDRELFDQRSIKASLKYSLTKQMDLIFEQGYRDRSYTDAGEDANNIYSELTWRKDLDKDRRLEFSARTESNIAFDRKYDFRRLTYGADYRQQISRADQIEIEARYRFRNYAFREGDGSALRSDKNFIFGVTYDRALTDNWILSLGYRYEKRHSNDSDKLFDESRFIIGLTHRWGLE